MSFKSTFQELFSIEQPSAVLETGRWENTDICGRQCLLCDNNALCDEMHYPHAFFSQQPRHYC